MFVRIIGEGAHLDVSPEVASRLSAEGLVVRSRRDGEVRVAPSIEWSRLTERATAESN